MSKAQKKPVVIDYLNIRRGEDFFTLKRWVESFGDIFEEKFQEKEPGTKWVGLKVKTLEGTSYDVTTNDVIIRGVKGEYYPCKKDIFKETYTPVGELLTPQEQELWDSVETH